LFLITPVPVRSPTYNDAVLIEWHSDGSAHYSGDYVKALLYVSEKALPLIYQQKQARVLLLTVVSSKM